MEKMTVERRNEIAYLYVTEMFVIEIPTLKPSEIKREINNTFKKLGISVEEASEFARELVLSLTQRVFPEPKTEEKEEILLGPFFKDKKSKGIKTVERKLLHGLGTAFD